MEKQKERLVELIKNTPHGINTLGDILHSLYIENVMVDHLLANGVIVQPCKVGDVVWLIKSLNWQQTDWGIKEGKISMIQQKADKSWKFRVTENHSVQDYTIDSIGKTVFLTKEEAEQALRKDEGK